MLNNLFIRAGAPTYSNETIDILRLIRSENVGPRTFARLIEFFGSASKALENVADFSVKGGRTKPIKICTKAAAEQEIEQLHKNNAYLLTYKDFNYSQLLLQIHDFPPVLTYKGNVELLNATKIVAIVGARNSSINSRSFAQRISADLVKSGYVTVSGLARGIDTAVHEVSGAQNIAVVAGGIDHIYPPENKKLYEKIIAEALLVAELPIGSKPLSQHFPQRNRIISGLSLATIVIEASLKSGSLITANYALEQNREVFAVPGFPLDPRCMGSNKLIKDGAYLLESSADIIANIASYQELKKSFEESSSYNNNFKTPVSSNNWEIKDSDRDMVITLLSSTTITYELLAIETKLAMPVIYTICLELELAGKIARHAGNRISLIY
ncbi:MAG: DNA-processing protein DprA [Rickettsiaceae bacterium]|nr:DNA-processing protein DprA [Rickettsiaceae bacterium]MDP4832937.1 DNA-processing protein DprA [Rickettsiaceae bacterium]MDP5020754.1 DNA-processing protein DprA [Rickettsiaceae bacterium]MDP5083477.1 DNA-processing protein DprA [Rickettsiaceae bacterium]